MSTASILSGSEPISCSLPQKLGDAIAHARKEWGAAQKAGLLWAREASLWLNVLETQIGELSDFKSFSAEVKEDGFTHLVLLAADGSANAANALRQAFRKQNGCLEWIVLDTTDPSRVRSVETRVNLARTLFCSLRGSQPAASIDLLGAYFYEQVKEAVGENARFHFIAVSSPADRFENDAGYRHVYSNDATAWGPFSDLSLVPLAAAGYDVEKLLNRARHMALRCQDHDSRHNPGVTLGLLLGAAARFGQNKLTVVCSPALRAAGKWIGHLATGMVPVIDEPFVAAETYSQDRLFVYLRSAHEGDRIAEKHVAELETAGHAVVRLILEEPADLGQSMFMWQTAAVVARSCFEHPTSQAPSQQTAAEVALLTQGDMTLYADGSYATEVMRSGDSAGAVLRRHLDNLNPGDYFGMVAYVPECEEHNETLQTMRKGVLQAKGVATVLGYGSGFLATAGASLLRGPSPGVLLLITCENSVEPLVLAHATTARAREDFDTLTRSGQRVVRVHLGSDVGKGLCQLQDLVCAAVEH